MKKFSVICADPPYAFSDLLSMSDVARGAKANYNTMTISKIKQIPVKSIAADDGAVLALWVPSSLLQEGLDIMKDWGFEHKQTYIWVKSKIDPLKDLRNLVLKSWDLEVKPLGNISFLNFKNAFKKSAKLNDFFNKSIKYIQDSMSFGMGRLFRQAHEICLIGTNNNKIYKKLMNKSQRSVSFGVNLKHSAKPEYLQDSLDLMFPNKDKIELFARRQRKGWYCLGNECPMTNGEDIYTSINKFYTTDDNDLLKINNIINNYDDSKSKEIFDEWQLVK